MFKFNFSEETSKKGNTAQDTVNSAGQAVQHVLDQVTETGQKVIGDTYKSVQQTGEKAVQNAAVNSAGQAVQHVLDQVTETGQKVIGDTYKSVQQTGEKAVQNAAVNSAGQAVQHVLDQVTETGQKVIGDTYKSVQQTGEKAVQNAAGEITAWGKSFGESGQKKTEEKKNVST